jgi:hypothetical protein
MPIVVGMKTAEEASADARNPFTPHFGRRNRNQKSR